MAESWQFITCIKTATEYVQNLIAKGVNELNDLILITYNCHLLT
ncbi:hypothetical protein BJQ96_01223 [Flavobacterium sp. PL0002]|nr:hypothetical protein [Flavobacterium sp. PL002]